MIEQFDEYRIPERMRPGILRYINKGVIPGDFLQAIITNNLREAFARADDENRHIIGNYVKLFYCHAPAGCWGSVDAMRYWQEEKKELRDDG